MSFYVLNGTVSIVNKHDLLKNAISAARFANIKRAVLSLRGLLSGVTDGEARGMRRVIEGRSLIF